MIFFLGGGWEGGKILLFIVVIIGHSSELDGYVSESEVARILDEW